MTAAIAYALLCDHDIELGIPQKQVDTKTTSKLYLSILGRVQASVQANSARKAKQGLLKVNIVT